MLVNSNTINYTINPNFDRRNLVPKKLNFSRKSSDISNSNNKLSKLLNLNSKKQYNLEPIDELEEEFEIIINFNNENNNKNNTNIDEFIKNDNNICVKKIRNLIISDDDEYVYYINPNGSKKVLLKKYLVAYKRVLDKKFTILSI